MLLNVRLPTLRQMSEVVASTQTEVHRMATERASHVAAHYNKSRAETARLLQQQHGLIGQLIRARRGGLPSRPAVEQQPRVVGWVPATAAQQRTRPSTCAEHTPIHSMYMNY